LKVEVYNIWTTRSCEYEIYFIATSHTNHVKQLVEFSSGAIQLPL